MEGRIFLRKFDDVQGVNYNCKVRLVHQLNNNISTLDCFVSALKFEGLSRNDGLE